MKTVLVVEDDGLIRESVMELLENEGYFVVGSANGQEALTYLQGASDLDLPSIILLDLMMPVMDGWSFRTLQLQDARIAHLPVIVITADGSAKERSKNMAVQAWIRKPVTITEILGTVAKFAI